jgi:hypothetical protein
METIEERETWNKGKLVGQKPPLNPKDIWAIRIHQFQRFGVGGFTCSPNQAKPSHLGNGATSRR